MKANLFRIAPSLMLAALMLALFVGVAQASQRICMPDGRPAIEFIGMPPNFEFGIAAFDQNDKPTKIEGKLDEKGNGTFPFGEPGVLYTSVLVIRFEGRRGTVINEYKDVKCEPPQATIESILGDVTKDWGRITDVITSWLTHWY